ncbi:MAG: DUF5522 domain-containing protein [Terracidiphilus sp.]
MTSDPPPAPLAPEDYYMEDSLLVFTAAYHLKRGTCCSSGCRHCPFGHENVPAGDSSTPPQSGADPPSR